MNNIPDPVNTQPISKILQGILNKQQLQATTSSLLPITLPVLQKLTDNLPFVTSSIYMQVTLKALFLFADYACTRAGEVVHSTDTAYHNLSPRDNGYDITFSSYKHSKGHQPTLTLLPASNSMYCPVTALKIYLQLRGPLFITTTGQPLTREIFSSFLKQALTQAGIPPTNYNTHSFRIGRATQMAINNISEDVIKATGRWQSDAYLKYVRPSHFVLPS
jgi:hypothetical protein